MMCRYLSFLLLGITLSLPVFGITLDDKGQINAVSVAQIVQVHNEGDIIRAIRQAKKMHLPISIMAKQHSQGGQSLAKGAIVLDMLPYHKVLNLDLKHKLITVQSGMTWDRLQKIINPYNLAIIVMQSSNIFSVGGSLSANAHGEDFRHNPISNSVIAFHLILSNGQKVLVTPQNTPALWKTVIGGYGLLGVISDVTLQLTNNDLLMGHYQETDIERFSHYFHTAILANNHIVLFFGRLSIVPGTNFLREMYTGFYTDTYRLSQPVIGLDNPEKWDFIIKPLFDWSRYSALGKKIRWIIEKHFFKNLYDTRLLTRNNAMQEPIHFAVDYHSNHNADWLQEYFIPVDQLSHFVDTLRTVAQNNDINLLNVVIRYIPKESDSILSYAKTNSFSIVIYFNQILAPEAIEKTRLWTHQLINTALASGGNYYLTYQDLATKEEFKRAYPDYTNYVAIKKQYDPQNLFTNKWYQIYFKQFEKEGVSHDI